MPASVLQQTELPDGSIQRDWSHWPLIIHQAPAFSLRFGLLCVYCNAKAQLKKSGMDGSAIRLVLFSIYLYFCSQELCLIICYSKKYFPLLNLNPSSDHFT